MPINQIWTIKHLGSNTTKTAADWGFDNIIGTAAAKTAESISLTMVERYDIDAPWSYRDEIEIYRDGVRWFHGIVIATPRSLEPGSETIGYQISGLWWFMENMTYLQDWQSADLIVDGPSDNQGINRTITQDANGDDTITITDSGDDVVKTLYTKRKPISHIRLFQDKDGNGSGTNDMLSELVQYAIDNGVPIQLGALPTENITPWPSDAKDVTIGQIFSSVLRWLPDVTPWIDYSTTPATLNFTNNSSASVSGISVDGTGGVVTHNISSRDEVRPPCVCLHYEITSRFDGEETLQIVSDIYPVGSDCKQPGAINITIPLRGVDQSSEVVSVVAERIPDNPKKYPDGEVPLGHANGVLGSNSIEGRKWWRRHLQYLRKMPGEQLVIHVEGNSTPTAIDGDIQFTEETTEDLPQDPLVSGARKLKDLPHPSDYPRELVEGTTDDWMEVHARKVDIHGKIFFKGNPLSGDPVATQFAQLEEETRAFFKYTQSVPLVIDGEDMNGLQYGAADITVRATDAITKNYNRTTSITPGESVPNGLAQKLYGQLSALRWEGDITTVSDEVGSSLLIGKVLNVPGGNAAWANMRAPIQSANFNVEEGETTIRFGVPQHLSVQDMVQLLNLGKENRFIPPRPRDNALATTGPSSPKVVQGIMRPVQNVVVNPGPGGGGAECTVLKAAIINTAEEGQTPQWAVAVSLGYINNQIPTIGESSLNAATAPSLPISGATTLWLAFEHVPTVDGFTDDGETKYFLDDGGDFQNIRFVLSTSEPASAAPTVNPDTGVKTNGQGAIRWADIVSDGNGGYKIEQGQCGSGWVRFCAPNNYTFG